MKVQAAPIVAFLDKLKLLVEDINLTIRMGDDGFEDTISEQVDNISKAIEIFKLQELTETTPLEKAEQRYNREYDLLSRKADKSSTEAIRLYQAELYFALKRLVRADANIAEVLNKDLCNYIESLIPDSSKYKKLVYSNEYFYKSLSVIQEVAEEMIEQRLKAPQTKMF